MTTPPFFRKVNPATSRPVHQPEFRRLCRCRRSTNTADRAGAADLATAGVAQVLVYGGRSSPYASRPIRSRPRRATSRSRISAPRCQDQFQHPVGTIAASGRTSRSRRPARSARRRIIATVVVAYRNGAPVKLDEIANVIDDVENNRIASFFNGNRSVVLAIQRQPDANTVAVVDSVKERIPAYRSQIPAAINMQVLMDRSISVRESVYDVQETLLIAIGLVILVIFLFLRTVSGHDHSGARGADLADRDLRGDVRAQFLDQQHDAAGAHAVGRIRRSTMRS
jgi:HAE1 family hydrophobic/amphiphilic exporter-1